MSLQTKECILNYISILLCGLRNKQKKWRNNMKKILTGVLCALGFANAYQYVQHGNYSVSVEDVYENVASHIFALKFTVQNNGTNAQNIRIMYPLPNDGKIYKIDRTLGADGIDTRTGVSNYDIYPLKGGIVNLHKDNATGQLSLDIMYRQEPGTNKFCIFAAHYDFSPIEKQNHGQMTFGINPSKTPYENPIIRHYEPRPRLETRLNGQPGETFMPRPGDEFMASVIHGDKEEVTINGKKTNVYDFNEWNPGSVGRETEKVKIRTIVDLNVPSFGTIKDTRMANLDMGELADYLGWTQSTFDGHMQLFTGSETREFIMGRCWANAVFNIYNYYYGNQNTKPDALTQDEMVYLARTRNNTQYVFRTFGVDGVTGEGDETSTWLFNRVIQGVNATQHRNYSEPLTEQMVIDFISAKPNESPRIGRPLWISFRAVEGNHAMLIDGVAEIVDMNGMQPKIGDDGVSGNVGVGTKVFHVVNLENFGTSGYITAENILQRMLGYITYDFPTMSTQYQKTNPLVSQDTDGDGLVDFDEEKRFHTESGYADSDGDGISDFNEIRSYVLRTTLNYNTKGEPQAPSELFAVGNGASLNRPELVMDFDNDGIDDDKEDKNKNGKYEPEKNETDPLTNESEQTTVENLPIIPDGLTFYALSELRLNDGTYCFKEGTETEYCDVGSGSTRKEYSTYIGARSKVGAIYTKGGIQLRDYSTAKKAILYKVPSYKDVSIQNHVSFDSKYTYYPSIANWPFAAYDNQNVETCDDGTEYKIVRNNETLENGAKYKMLKVEAGATLTINPGSMCIGELQLDPGSNIAFSNPNKSTEIQVNNNVIWRSSLSADDATIKKIAKHFLLTMQTSNHIYIDTKWAGSIYAPKTSLILAQTEASKKLYGTFLANYITVHQKADVYTVKYERALPTLNKSAKRVVAADFSAPALGNTKILGLDRNNVHFDAAEAGTYTVSIMKANGEKIASMTATNAQAGRNVLPWNSTNVTPGIYFISIKHNGTASGMKVFLR